MAALLIRIEGKTAYLDGRGGVSDKTLKFIESLGLKIIIVFN